MLVQILEISNDANIEQLVLPLFQQNKMRTSCRIYWVLLYSCCIPLHPHVHLLNLRLFSYCHHNFMFVFLLLLFFWQKIVWFSIPPNMVCYCCASMLFLSLAFFFSLEEDVCGKDIQYGIITSFKYLQSCSCVYYTMQFPNDIRQCHKIMDVLFLSLRVNPHTF